MDQNIEIKPLAKKFDLETVEDRLSSLPDEVIIYILSFLTTRDALRISLLSLRWEKMWAYVPNLDFCPPETNKYDPYFYLKYMNFIERVLLLHDSRVVRFHVDCIPGIDISRLNSWISALLKRNVQEIDISCDFRLQLLLPRRLFTCKYLVVLKIGHSLSFDVPSSIYFPSLKVLHIRLVSPSNDFIDMLLSSCPVLEELSIRLERYSGKTVYDFSSPILKTLCINIHSYEFDILENMVTIDAPVLKFLDVRDDCLVHYCFKNLPSLSEAYVDINLLRHRNDNTEDVLRVDNLRMLLIALSNVNNLFLGACTMDGLKDLSYAIEEDWPVFRSITHLHLEIQKYSGDHNFIEWSSFPNVKHLVLKVGKDFGSKNLSSFLNLAPNLASLMFQRVRQTKHLGEFDPSVLRGVPPPVCLWSSLKKINLYNFEGSNNELKLIKFMLESAQVLEILSVEQCKFEKLPEEEFRNKIIAMRRSSKISRVVFI